MIEAGKFVNWKNNLNRNDIVACQQNWICTIKFLYSHQPVGYNLLGFISEF